MAKNILIFSDGTGQAGGVRPDQRLSNVYKLYRATRTGPDSQIDPAEQVTFYDAGLGTDDNVGSQWLRSVALFKKLLSSATGRGITKNITDCYEAILNYYEPGDRIYFLGFSRGAYTVRCVAGVLALCGIPTLGRGGQPLPRFGYETHVIADEAVRKVYEHGAGRNRAKFEAEREEQARRFRLRYGCDTHGGANVAPYFIGVFETVASLGARGLLRGLLVAGFVAFGLCTAGIVSATLHSIAGLGVRTGFWWTIAVILGVSLYKGFRSTVKVIRDFPSPGNFHWHIAKWEMKNYDRGLDHSVSFARHALSIDESRVDFPRVQWGFKQSSHVSAPGDPEFLKQIWFAGNHSDIGGSYPEEESRLSDITLQWMIEQLQMLPHPPLMDSTRLHLFPWEGGMQHSEVDAMRDQVRSWLPLLPARLCPTWKEAVRIEVLDAPVHDSVEKRFQLPVVLQSGRLAPYRPTALRADLRFSHLYPPVPLTAGSGTEPHEC